MNILAIILIGALLIPCINMGWMSYNKVLKIKLPKSKKYKNKVNPIYKLEQNRWGNSKYQIDKYVLEYRETEWNTLLIILIPFPISILKYQYYNINHPYSVDDNILNENCDINIGFIWEQKYTRYNDNLIKSQAADKKKQDCINKINKQFNENYENL